jgi:hypothetical protein
MSGAEPAVVLGVISSVITIIDSVRKVYSAAADGTGLPVAFKDVVDRLPLVQKILATASEDLKKVDLDDETHETIKRVVKACANKVQVLQLIFSSVIPDAGASRWERYYRALRTVGKDHRVEKLMKGILEDVGLLADNRCMEKTQIEIEANRHAIEDVDAIPPSIEDHLLADPSFTSINSQQGTQSNCEVHGNQSMNNAGEQQVSSEEDLSHLRAGLSYVIPHNTV